MSALASNGGNGTSGLRSTSALERIRARRQNGGSDPYSSDSSEKLANGSSGKLNGDSTDTSANATPGSESSPSLGVKKFSLSSAGGVTSPTGYTSRYNPSNPSSIPSSLSSGAAVEKPAVPEKPSVAEKPNKTAKRDFVMKNGSSPSPDPISSMKTKTTPESTSNGCDIDINSLPPSIHTTTSTTTSKSDKLASYHHMMDSNKAAEAVNGDVEAAPKHREGVKQLDGYVGFANLPNQVYRKSVKRGFEFTLMVVGESGLGKSTLINSLFLTELYSNSEYPGPSHRIKKTVNVETSKVVLKEGGVQLSLTIVDTPGFGDAVDNSNCWQPITDFIENKYEEYLNSESRVERTRTPDNRVHCCLYFIAPSGHGLKPLDIEFMKRLHDKVNIIPLIAKADTLTPDECASFKKTILNEIAQHGIKIYEFPDAEDEDENRSQKAFKERVPFAVVGSNTTVEVNGKKVRGRQYPWGIVEVDNISHCDFLALRNMVIRTHMQDLKDVTNNVHYENYRYRKLAGAFTGDSKTKNFTKSPILQMEEEKKEHAVKMKKMEAEMEQVFEMKVKEKKQKLKDSEADLQRRHEQMKKSLEQQAKELEEKIRTFDLEKVAWDEEQREMEQSLRGKSLESNASKDSLDGKDKKKDKKKHLF